MEVALIDIIGEVKNYWIEQKVISSNNTVNLINKSMVKKPGLPNDFILFYTHINGMENYYPNYFDKEGFLVYPFENLVYVEDEFELSSAASVDYYNIIFADYMHRSWWYSVKSDKQNENNYEILLIASKNEHKFITNSLTHFFQLYLSNSDMLYP